MASASVNSGSGNGIRWRAPGKMFLAGEYAVTDGAHALIAAVPPWGELTTTNRDTVEPLQPLYPGAPRAPRPHAWLDTRGFFADGDKLGFGSSATAAVLLAAARNGLRTPAELWRDAEQAHRELVGKSGSGGDLAAVIHGGVGLYRRDDGAPVWRRVPFPPHAGFAVVRAGMSADTRLWVDRLRQARDSSAWRDWRDALDRVVRSAAEGATLGDVIAAAAEHYRELRRWLGDALYPPLFEQCDELARALGLPFKPSGAGGGDIAFFYVEDRESWQALLQALSARDIPVRLVRPAVTGIVYESSAPPVAEVVNLEEAQR